MTIESFPKALVASVTICSIVYFLTHMYSINAVHQYGAAYRLNNMTGSVLYCAGTDCTAVEYK